MNVILKLENDQHTLRSLYKTSSLRSRTQLTHSWEFVLSTQLTAKMNPHEYLQSYLISFECTPREHIICQIVSTTSRHALNNCVLSTSIILSVYKLCVFFAALYINGKLPVCLYNTQFWRFIRLTRIITRCSTHHYNLVL